MNHKATPYPIPLTTLVYAHLLCLAVALLRTSEPAVYFGRMSRNGVVIAVALIVALPLVMAFVRYAGWLLRPLNSQRIAAVTVALAVAGAFVVWWVPLGSTAFYALLRLYGVVWLLTVGMCAAQMVPGLDRDFPRISVGVALAFGLVAVFLSRDFMGLLWTDEGYMLSEALTFARTGDLYVNMFQPAEIALPSVTYLLLGWWHQVFPVTLANARLFIFLVGLGGVLLTSVAAYRIAGWQTAACVSVLVVAALLRWNVLRQDVGVMVALGGAWLALVLVHQTQRVRWHGVVGLAAGLALDGHPNTYRFVLALGLVYVAQWLIKRVQTRHVTLPIETIYYGVGAVVGVGLYVAFYYLLLGERFLAFFESDTSAPLVNSPRVLLDQINGWLAIAPILLLGAVGGLIAGFAKRDSLVLTLGATWIVSMLLLATTYGYHRDYYTLHSFSLMALLTAAWVNALPSKPAQTTAVLVLVAAAAGVLQQHYADRNNQSYESVLAVAEEVDTVLADDITLVGVDPMYFTFYDHANFVEINTEYYAQPMLNDGDESVWQQLEPDAVVIVERYPLPVPPRLADYITQEEWGVTHCWQNEVLGQVRLYQPTTDTSSVPPCTPIAD